MQNIALTILLLLATKIIVKLFLSKSLRNDLNLPHESIYCKINETFKKITRSCDTSSFPNYKLLATNKETIRLRNTNSLC